MTKTIRAKHIPVDQPKIPPCEKWVVCQLMQGGGRGTFQETKSNADKLVKTLQKQNRKMMLLHLTDQLPDVEAIIEEFVATDRGMARLSRGAAIESLRDFAGRLGVIE